MEAGGMKGERRERKRKRKRRVDGGTHLTGLGPGLVSLFCPLLLFFLLHTHSPSLASPRGSVLVAVPLWSRLLWSLWLRLYLPFSRILSRLPALRVLEILASPPSACDLSSRSTLAESYRTWTRRSPFRRKAAPCPAYPGQTPSTRQRGFRRKRNQGSQNGPKTS